MKRYDPFQPEIIGRDMYESSEGEYVKYDDIKDDRALLEEAIVWIKNTTFDVNEEELNAANRIIKRVKELGIGG